MKCPVCGNKIQEDDQRLCECCGWEFDRYVTELSSRERELYDRKLGLARQNWKELLQAREKVRRLKKDAARLEKELEQERENARQGAGAIQEASASLQERKEAKRLKKDAARLEKELEQERENSRQATQKVQSLENTLKEWEKALSNKREIAEEAERDARNLRAARDKLQVLVDDYEVKLRKEQKRAKDALKNSQNTLQRQLDDAARNVYRLSDAVRLSPWNPLDWFRLLVWILLQPARLETYRAALTSEADRRALRQTRFYMAMALLHVPIALISIWIYLRLPLLTSTINDKVVLYIFPYVQANTSPVLWILHHWQILVPAYFLSLSFCFWGVEKFSWIDEVDPRGVSLFFFFLCLSIPFLGSAFFLFLIVICVICLDYPALFLGPGCLLFVMMFPSCLDDEDIDSPANVVLFGFPYFTRLVVGGLVISATGFAADYILTDLIVVPETVKVNTTVVVAGIVAGVLRLKWEAIFDKLEDSFPKFPSTRSWPGRVIFGLLVLYWAGLGAGLFIV